MNISNAKFSSFLSQYDRFRIDINCSEIWYHLGKCDIYSATVKLLLAQSIVQYSPELDAYFSPSFHEKIKMLKLSSPIRAELLSCTFLREVIGPLIPLRPQYRCS